VLARNLGIGIGKKITLISPTGNVTALGTMPRLRSYKIAGIFNVGMHVYDSNYIFMPLKAAQQYFSLPEAVNYLDVMLADPDAAKAKASIISRALNGYGSIIDWQQANSGYFNAIQVERNVMFLILTLIILVAALNMISSLIMLVRDKGPDIAILRTMGATRGMIMRVFFLSGASIGVIGTVVGFGLGLVVAENIEAIRQWIQFLTGTDVFAAEIYFLSQLPAEIDPEEVTVVTVMALGLSFIRLES